MIMDKNMIIFILLSIFYWGFLLAFIKWFFPYFNRKSIQYQISNVRIRNFILFSELLPESQKGDIVSMNNLLEGRLERRMQLFLLIFTSYAFIKTIIIFYPINDIISQVINYPFAILLVISFVYLLRVGSYSSFYARAWHQLLLRDYSDIHISFKSKILGISDIIIYTMARTHIQRLYDKEITSLFNEKLVSTIHQASRYNKTEDLIVKTIEKYNLEHLWYDKNIVFGNKKEKYRLALFIVLISCLIIFTVAFLLYFVGNTSFSYVNNTDPINLVIVFFPIILYTIIAIIYDNWYIAPNLTKAGVINFLINQDIVYDKENSFQTMRKFIDERFNVFASK